jgi:hypothetical protein
MAKDTDTRTLPLAGLVGGKLLEAVDPTGRLTDDPTTAVEGTLVVTYQRPDGTTYDRHVGFDRAHPVPSGTVGA